MSSHPESVVLSPPTASSLRAAVSLESTRWQSSRWQWTSRPFSAASIVSLRCPLPTRLHYAGAAPAVKLYSLLRQHFADKSFAHTFGCLDAVQVAPHTNTAAPTAASGRDDRPHHTHSLTHSLAHSLLTVSLCPLSLRGGGHGSSPVHGVRERLAVLFHGLVDQRTWPRPGRCNNTTTTPRNQREPGQDKPH